MADLTHVLRQLPQSADPNLLVGTGPADDAAVYRLRDDLLLVQTVDFFTPVVDDPYLFGQIAAANSLSDIYAMGATPRTALNIVGFPLDMLPADTLVQILRGGADMAREAGVTIVGGHTIDDSEPKYGLAVTGTVDGSRFITAREARPGDLLVLTKPLGTGTITTALKAEAAEPHWVQAAVRWMTTLNRSAATVMQATAVSAATDVSGFGLLGHLHEMCEASGVGATVSFSACPLLPGAVECTRAGFVPKGTRNNLDAVGNAVRNAAGLDDTDLHLLSDPQTSGGLLIALPASSLDSFQRAAARDMLAAVIGQVDTRPPGEVELRA